MRLVLPMPPNAANSRRHWRVVLKEKKAYWRECDMLQIARLIPDAPDEPPQKVRLHLTAYVGNLHDIDNLFSRGKIAIDWLKTRGYIVDDKQKHLEWAGLPEQVVDRKSPRLEITLEEVAA